MTTRAGRAVVLLLVSAAPALACGALERAPPPTLGLCPPDARRLDSYMQAICEGETALRQGGTLQALERFRVAAALPRVAATNELAWAGLAAAHCHAGEFDDGRRWAAYFAQARRLWLGEIDCAADTKEARTAVSPFVRSRMCSERLVADYALVRANAQATYSIDLRDRLNRVNDAIAQACTVRRATLLSPPDGANAAKGAKEKVKTKKRRGRRVNSTPSRSQAAAKPKPD